MSGSRIFGLSDWETWLDRMARATLGMSGAEFEAAWMTDRRGERCPVLPKGVATDLGSILSLIQRLRKSVAIVAVTS